MSGRRRSSRTHRRFKLSGDRTRPGSSPSSSGSLPRGARRGGTGSPWRRPAHQWSAGVPATQPEGDCEGVTGRLGAVAVGGVELPHQLCVSGLLDGQQCLPIPVADGGGDLVQAVQLLEDSPLQMVVALEYSASDLAELVGVIRVQAQVLHE
ncbi:unnamed protein product [Linum trigynum]|uniref:Uncharacterized protein n=1 Tax=Linum trigynum TaxID=586398 RepID=A0AAV2FV52_9ROSI